MTEITRSLIASAILANEGDELAKLAYEAGKRAYSLSAMGLPFDQLMYLWTRPEVHFSLRDAFYRGVDDA